MVRLSQFRLKNSARATKSMIQNHERLSSTTKSMTPEARRTQEYYDAIAKGLYNPKTGNTIYSTTSGSFVGKDCNNRCNTLDILV